LVHAAVLTSFAAPPQVFALHATPQAPQLLLSVCGLVEQLVPSPGQFTKGGVHFPTVHFPPVQAGVPFVVVHVSPQAAQLVNVPSGVSQSVPGLPGQWAKPALQLPTPQTPPLHTGVPCAVVHLTPHPPQLLTSLPRTKVSQLFPGCPGQWA
jgi:hypothetical protein